MTILGFWRKVESQECFADASLMSETAQRDSDV